MPNGNFIGFCQSNAYFFRNRLRLGKGFGFTPFQLANQGHKLVPADARDRIHFPHAILDALANFNQQQVPRLMTLRIV